VIIILNWNGWQDTLECLESLYQVDYPNYDVILIDNGSKDKSIKKIREYAEGEIRVESKFFEYSSGNKPIKIVEYTEEEAGYDGGKEIELKNLLPNKKMILIKNDRNYGFAGGNNIGIRYALRALNPKHILLLNNDTVVDKKFLIESVNLVESNNKIGMIATKLLFHENPRIINSVGTIIFRNGSAAHLGCREVDTGQYNQVFETFAPCAAAALYRSEMLKEIGLLDEDFFAYLEDVDLGWRARLAGWTCLFSPKSVVYHKHSASSKPYSKFKLYQLERNRLLLALKNYPTKYIGLLPVLDFYRYSLMFLVRKSNIEVSKYYSNVGVSSIFTTVLKSMMDFLRYSPKFLLKRKQVQRLIKVNDAEIEDWFKRFSKNFSEVLGSNDKYNVRRCLIGRNMRRRR
jgi:GT2 family glycosyltransferase